MLSKIKLWLIKSGIVCHQSSKKKIVINEYSAFTKPGMAVTVHCVVHILLHF